MRPSLSKLLQSGALFASNVSITPADIIIGMKEAEARRTVRKFAISESDSVPVCDLIG